MQAAVTPDIPISNCFATLSKDENSEGGSINSPETTKDEGDEPDEDKARQRKEKRKIDQKERRELMELIRDEFDEFRRQLKSMDKTLSKFNTDKDQNKDLDETREEGLAAEGDTWL